MLSVVVPDAKKPPINLRANLIAYLHQKNIGEEQIDEVNLKKDYWRNTTLTAVKAWLTEECPKLKNNFSFTLDGERWLAEMQERVKRIESKPNLSQTHLNSKLATFQERHNLPSSAQIAKKLRTSEGHCSGHSCADAIAVTEQQQPTERKEDEPKKYLTKTEMEEARVALSSWDGQSELRKGLRANINTLCRVVYDAQNSRELLSLSQADWHEIYPRFKLLYSMPPLPLTKQNLTLVTNELLLGGDRLSGEPEEKQKTQVEKTVHNEFLAIVAKGHATHFDKETQSNSSERTFAYFDANSIAGSIPGLGDQDQGALVSLPFAAHQFNNNTPNIFVAQMFGVQAVYRYKTSAEILSKVDVRQLTVTYKAQLLIEAMRVNCDDSFDFWRQQGANLNYLSYEDGLSVLHYAAQWGRAEMLKKLFVLGVTNINAVTNKKGEAPLHLAVQFGFTKVVDAILERKDANLEITTAEDKTPLHVAAENSQSKMVDYLIARGANLFAFTVKGKFAFELAENPIRQTLIAAMLQQLKAQNNIPGYIKNLFFFAVSSLGEAGALRELLQAGIDVNSVDPDRGSALYLAVLNNQTEVAEVLLEAKADVNFDQGDTPLHVAISPNKNLQMVNLLLKHGADAEAKSSFGSSLELAEKRYQLANDETSKKIRDLIVVTTIAKRLREKNYDAAVELLETYRPDINTRMSDRHSLFTLAAELGSLTALNVLLAYKPDVNFKGPSRNTALHFASRGGHLGMVQMLLSHDANPTMLNDDWDNTLDVATGEPVQQELFKVIGVRRLEIFQRQHQADEKSFWQSKAKVPKRVSVAKTLSAVVAGTESKESLKKPQLKKILKHKELNEVYN